MIKCLWHGELDCASVLARNVCFGGIALELPLRRDRGSGRVSGNMIRVGLAWYVRERIIGSCELALRIVDSELADLV
jgi:hypothetical protein